MDAVFFAKVAAFVLYLGMMIFIGLRSASKNNSSADFFLGGRKVGPWVTALSAEASDSSAWLLMGLPGLCYLGGVQESLWTAVGLIAGTYISWLFVAKPLRKCSITFGDSITIPEFLSNRFNDKSHILSIVSVIFIVLFFTIYTASGFVACAKLFNSVFGLNYYAGLAIGLVVILCYTVTGGYSAVCKTDFVQGLLIFIAFVVSTLIAIVALGGPSEAYTAVKDFGTQALEGNFGVPVAENYAGNATYKGMSIISALAWGLGYLGMPHIIVRFMGIRSNKEIKKARRIGISWMLISYIGAILIGTMGTAYLLKTSNTFLSNGKSIEKIEKINKFYDAAYDSTKRTEDMPKDLAVEKVEDKETKEVYEIVTFTEEGATEKTVMKQKAVAGKEGIVVVKNEDGKLEYKELSKETENLKVEAVYKNGGDSEIVFSKTMDNMYFPFLAGIFLCAILAAAMSTADSQLLAASSAVSQDIFKGLIKKDAEEKDVMTVSRVTVFLIALVALLLSLNENSSIFSLVSFAWSGFGGTFGPLVLLALYWKRTTAPGAIAGLICGGVTDVVWYYVFKPQTGLYEIVPAFIVCLVVTVIVSLLTKPDAEVQAKFDAYKKLED